MNNDNYLNFLYKLIEEEKIIEKNKLNKFFNSKKIENSKTYKKKISTTTVIVPIKLDNQKILLIKDIPLNFLISYGVLIGDTSQLIEFKLKNKDEKYITERKVAQYLLEEIDKETIKELKPETLFLKKIICEYDKTPILTELKKYVNEKKKLDLNKIHIIESSKIENFTPNIKIRHFRIAETLRLPLTSFIENNYLKDSTININDFKSQIELIKPIKTLNEELIWDLEKKTNNILYKDISREIIINFNKKNIFNNILNAKIVNFDKNKLLKEINKIESIEISSDIGKVPIPLWKSINTQKYVKIKDENDFFQISGVKFDLDTKKLQKIYIENTGAEEAKYRNKYLKKEFEKTFFELKKDSKIIEFKTTKDLILKLMYNQNIPEKIIKTEDISKKQILQIKKRIQKIINITILETIKVNKFPQINTPQTITEKYYASIFSSLYLYNNEYQNFPSNQNLIKKSLKKIESLINTLETQKIKENEIYFLYLITIISIKIIYNLNKQYGQELEELFFSYVKELKIDLKKSTIDEKIEYYINQITLTNKLAKKYKIKVLYKNKQYDEKLLNSKIEILDKKPKIAKNLIQPNMQKLKEIFKYSSENIGNQIKNKNLDQKDFKNLYINEKKIGLKTDFYNVFDEYENYKILVNNKWFQVLTDKK